MAPAQGWHAQIEKCKQFFRIQPHHILFWMASLLGQLSARPGCLLADLVSGHRKDHLHVVWHVHTFSAFWLWSSVVSVLISVTTDMSPTGDLLVTWFFSGEAACWACPEHLMCCTGMAHCYEQHTHYWVTNLESDTNPPPHRFHASSKQMQMERMIGAQIQWNQLLCSQNTHCSRVSWLSQRSLHNAPIFRLLLKVAVNGTHQCDFPNFCGQQCPTCFCIQQAITSKCESHAFNRREAKNQEGNTTSCQNTSNGCTKTNAMFFPMQGIQTYLASAGLRSSSLLS